MKIQSDAVWLNVNDKAELHSFEDVSHSVAKIVNGRATGRRARSPLTDFGVEMLSKKCWPIPVNSNNIVSEVA